MQFNIQTRNKKIKNRFFLYIYFFLLILFSYPSYATQIQQILFNSSGYSSEINSIIQDNDGYLWLGTINGLYRFDGNKLKNYTYSGSKNDLSNSFINRLFISSSNDLWIGTRKGINLFNKDTNNFTQYLNESPKTARPIWGIYESPDKKLYVNTDSKLFRWNPEEKNFELIIDNKINKMISIIFIDKYSILVASRTDGLFAIDLQTKEITPYYKNDELLQENTRINQLIKNEHNITVNTTNGVFTTTASLNQFKKEPEIKTDLKNITYSLIDQNGSQWIGSTNNLYIKEKNIPIKTVAIQDSAKPINVNTIYQDKAGNIWVGSKLFLGLHRSRSTAFNKIALRSVLAIDATDEGLWYINDSHKLFYYTDKEKILRLEIPDYAISHNYKIHADPVRDVVWLSSHGRLFKFNLTSNKLTEIILFPDSKGIDEVNFEITSNGNIWASYAETGLYKYDPTTEDITNYKPLTKDLIDFRAKYLKIIDDNKILLGGIDGIVEFDIKTKTYKHIYTKNTAAISAINKTADSILFGTQKTGLHIYDTLTKETISFNHKNGLIDNNITNIINTNDGYTWITSSFGLYRLNNETNSLKIINAINKNHSNYNKGAASTSKDRIYLGETSGLIRFEPKLTTTKIRNKKVLIKSLQITNSNNAKQNKTYKTHETNQISLKNSENSFSINFNYISPADTGLINYRYKLAGFHNEWISTNNIHAIFKKIPTGTYEFLVQVSTLDDFWKSEISKLQIIIEPPFWFSIYAKIIYLAIFCIGLFLVYKSLRNKKLAHKKIIESEDRLRLSLWGSNSELWDWHVTEHKLYRSNTWGLNEFPQDGYRSHTDDISNIHAADLKNVQQLLSDHIDNKSSFFEATYRVKNEHNTWVWVLDIGKVTARDSNNFPTRMTGTIRDISNQKKAEQKMQLLLHSIENISDGYFILNKNFKFLEINHAFTKITSFTKKDVYFKQMFFRSYPNYFNNRLKQKLTQNGKWVGDLAETRANGEVFHIQLTLDAIKNNNNKIINYVGIFSDITQQKKSKQELHRLTIEDSLTKLPNRTWFQAEHAKLVSSQTSHACLLFDLDNFKLINDSLGHKTGDELLIEIAHRLKETIKTKEALFRLGGDEFALLMETSSNSSAITNTTNKLLNVFKTPFNIGNQNLYTTCSIGIVLYPLDGKTPEELLRNADAAMYQAKNSKNKYKFFSTEMNANANEQLHLENLLREAIKMDYFVLYYQPKIDISTGVLNGMEALLRIQPPTRTPSPDLFIPIAEESGLIIKIGEIVLLKACIATKKWVDAGLMNGRVAVNVSAKQFSSPDFVATVKHALQISNLNPKNLELELTEGALMNAPDNAIAVMKQIKELGIYISLDDFGTGYSSLSYLQRFPIDSLKIDKSFIQNMTTTEHGINMASSIISLAHNLNLSVIAEGVETQQEFEILKAMQCETAQGYLFSKPLPAENFIEFLRKNHN